MNNAERRLSRRAVLTTTVAAGAAAASSAALSDTVATAAFGAPAVEMQFPAGILSLEQKGEMIQRVTDVLVNAMKLPPEQAKKLFVQIFETTESGFGIAGRPIAPRKT